jgi:hypothetical protein
MNALILLLSLCSTERFTFQPEIEHVIHASSVEQRIYVNAKTDGEIFKVPIINGYIPTISQEKDDHGNVIRRDFYYDQKIPYTGQNLLDFNPKIKETIVQPTVAKPDFIPVKSEPPVVVKENNDEEQLFKDVPPQPLPKEQLIPTVLKPEPEEQLFKDVPPQPLPKEQLIPTVLKPEPEEQLFKDVPSSETKTAVHPQPKTIKPVAAKTSVAKTNVNACGCQPTHYHHPKKPWKKRYRR